MAPDKLFERASVIRQQNPRHQRIVNLRFGGWISYACHHAD
jgi:hypothetical protein